MIQKGMWWKLSGIILFLYVLWGGMTIPLRPGITSINPSSAKTGDTIELKATGYNTHFATVGNGRAWLKLDSVHAIKALTWQAENDNEVTLRFILPQTLPNATEVFPLHLIIDNETDGAFVHPNALFLSSSSDTLSFDAKPWTKHELGQFNDHLGIQFPYRSILNETIRNTFFHVALWFAMFLLLIFGVVYSIRYLSTSDYDFDRKASAYTNIAVLYGIFGILTGSVWAKFTWNTFWTNDVKLNMTAIALLIYLAYIILRGMNYDQDKRARLAAIYNIFAFIALIPLVFVIPRMTDSLHPGNGGNPALGGEDLDHTLRMFFYPSILALFLIGKWIAELTTRFERVKDHFYLKKS